MVGSKESSDHERKSRIMITIMIKIRKRIKSRSKSKIRMPCGAETPPRHPNPNLDRILNPLPNLNLALNLCRTQSLPPAFWAKAGEKEGKTVGTPAPRAPVTAFPDAGKGR
jgi:hypothetical protein